MSKVRHKGDHVGAVYYVREIVEVDPGIDTELGLNSSNVTEHVSIWHRRLGHINFGDLNKALKKHNLTGNNLPKIFETS